MSSDHTHGSRSVLLFTLVEKPDLNKGASWTMDSDMNAAEIIVELRSLPPEEKGKVLQFVRELGEEEAEIAAAIEEGIADIEEGRVYSSAEVREQLKSWCGK